MRRPLYARLLWPALVALTSASLAGAMACNSSTRSGPTPNNETNNQSTNNNTSTQNNDTNNSTNNSTSTQNNNTAGTNNNTAGTNNNTAGTNNNTAGTNNNTAGTNNNTAGNNSAADALARCVATCDRIVACPNLQRYCDVGTRNTLREDCRLECNANPQDRDIILAFEAASCEVLEEHALSQPAATACEIDLCAQRSCSIGQRCEPANGSCVPFDCQPDRFEGEAGNNNLASATTLTLEDSAWDDLSICNGDEDWFRIDLPAQTEVLIQARFIHSQGDIDLVLRDDEGFRLDSSNTSTDDEFIYIAPQDEAFLLYLSIDGYQMASNAYTLQIDVAPEGELCQEPEDCAGICDVGRCAPCTSDAACGSGLRCSAEGVCVECVEDSQCRQGVCAPEGACVQCFEDTHCGGDMACVESFCIAAICNDPLEPNSAAHPHPLTDGSYDGLYLCEAKSDWYSVELPNGGNLYAVVEFSHATADLDARLLSAEGQELYRASSFNDNEYIAGVNLPPGVYTLRVLDGVLLNVPYSITVDTQPSFQPCRDDDDDCPEGQRCNDEARCE